MKKLLSLLLTALLLVSLLTGCSRTTEAPAEPAEPAAEAEPIPAAEPSSRESVPPEEPEETPAAPMSYDDGRARPSSCGRLQVLAGKLCGADGEPVMLRGVSINGIMTAEAYLNEELFRELAAEDGVNLFRLAMYTYGVGSVGYCTGGDKERHKLDIIKGVDYARNQDMYVLVDWHILSDGDPNSYLEDARDFFSEMAERFSGYDNVLYEICNEPNGVDWPVVKRYAEEIIPVIREKDPSSVIVVGNPDWSKDLDAVAADPLEFDNILYTFHFYSATHGQDLRDRVERHSQAGLPIFVTEFGVTASNGGFPRDLEGADAWIELLEREKISYCMWSFSSAAEPCSALRFGVLKHNGFAREDFTETGLWLLDTLAKYKGR